MAAPSSFYRTKSIMVRKGTDNITNQRAIPDATTAILKERYYLDHLIITKDSDGNEGFTGFCREGSTNASFHSPSRVGSLRMYQGGVCTNYLDAGLNTLGFASSTFSSLHVYSNLIVLSQALFKSAWHVNTNEYGFEFRIGTGAWIRHKMPSSALPKQQQIDGKTVIRKFPKLEEFTQYQVRAYLENDEGTYYTTIGSITTGDYLDSPAFMKRTSACSTTGQTQITAFMTSAKLAQLDTLTTTAQNKTLFAYKDDVNFVELDTGWYSQGQQDSYYYSKGVGFTHKEVCVVAPTITLNVSVKIWNDGTYDVTATTTVVGTQPVVYNAMVSALNGSGVTVASFPINVTIAANQLTGNNSGVHGLMNPSQYMNWNVSGTVDGRGINTSNIFAVAYSYDET